MAKNTVKITESAVRRYDKKIKLTDLIHERERSRAIGAIFSRDKRHQKRNRSVCFENVIIYWNLSSLLFTVAAFTLKKVC